MEQESNFEEFEKIPTSKVFREKSFWGATFFGGPIVAGYLFAENFKALGKTNMVKKTWFVTLISTIAILIIAFFIVDYDKIPKQMLPIVYSGIAFGLFKNYQSKDVDIHLTQGGKHQSFLRVVVVTILGLVLTLLLIIFISFVLDIINILN